MKNKLAIIFLILMIFLLIGAVIFVPKIFPKNTNQSNNDAVISSISSVTSVQTSNVSSVAVKTYTLSEMIAESDNVLYGTIIKADVYEDGVLYTFTVDWKNVYKGRNYATMGYAYVEGLQNLEMDKTYLFIGDTDEAKYHYKEPFDSAPWVFEIEDNALIPRIHPSNGDVKLVTDLSEITLENVKNICKAQVSGK